MPREQITHNRIVAQSIAAPTISDSDDAPEAIVHQEVARKNLHIEWNRTGGSGALGVQHDIGWVQFGIEVSVADLRSMLASAEAQAQAESRKYADIGAIDTEACTFRVTSDVLDRRETNLAISALRRARDVAYGKDA